MSQDNPELNQSSVPSLLSSDNQLPPNIKYIKGFIEVLSAIPTFIPKNFYDSIKIYNGSLYIYNYSTSAWFTINVVTLAALRPVYSGTFASGSNTYNKTDANVTANSIIDVYAQSTPIGTWSVSSSVGSFTITSTATETGNVAFKYFINN
jgi:hypothetical protein